MAEDYKTRFECAEGLIKKLVTEINEKNTIIAVLQTENRQLKEETEIRYNPITILLMADSHLLMVHMAARFM